MLKILFSSTAAVMATNIQTLDEHPTKPINDIRFTKHMLKIFKTYIKNQRYKICQLKDILILLVIQIKLI